MLSVPSQFTGFGESLGKPIGNRRSAPVQKMRKIEGSTLTSGQTRTEAFLLTSVASLPFFPKIGSCPYLWRGWSRRP
jgi:hypothetical protein